MNSLISSKPDSKENSSKHDFFNILTNISPLISDFSIQDFSVPSGKETIQSKVEDDFFNNELFNPELFTRLKL